MRYVNIVTVQTRRDTKVCIKMSQKTEDLLNRFFRFFYLTVTGDCLLIAVFITHRNLMILQLGMFATLLSFVLLLSLLYNYWSFIPAKDGWIGSTAAVLLLLIPLFGTAYCY